MEAFVDAPVEVTSVEDSATFMEASVEAFVEATSTEAFVNVSVEANLRVFSRVEASTEAFMSFHAKSK